MIQVWYLGHEAITPGVSHDMVRPFGEVGSVCFECGFCELFAKKSFGSTLKHKQRSAKSHDC